MTINERIRALDAFGKHLQEIPIDDLDKVSQLAYNHNPWFTRDNILKSLEGIRKFLHQDKLEEFVKPYNIKDQGLKVGIVMAGNIPFVGFHDLLCVLLSGNIAMIKLSSKDEQLPTFLINELFEVEPAFREQIRIVDKLKDYDAVIATGSDNTSRYFEYYFGKKPNIIRRNRVSAAILTGEESEADLEGVGWDIFQYFGLGCRNVSKLYVPTDYDFQPFLNSLSSFSEVGNHNKYRNNYDYFKSIYLVNKEDFLDTGFVLFKRDERIASPVSVIFYEEYENQQQLIGHLKISEKIQCLVGNQEGLISPGEAQSPGINDFADNTDTMQFLTELL